MASAPGLTENVASALCYLLGFITGIVFLVLDPYNRNKTVRFHAFQSIFLSVATIIIRIAIGFTMTFSFVLWNAVSLVFSLAIFVLWLFLMWKAYQNQKVVLPIIGPLAQQQA